MLPTNQIPQANSLDRLIQLARHVAEHGCGSAPADFGESRDLSYYRRALLLLGWVTEDNTPTAGVRDLPRRGAALRAAVIAAVDASAIGIAWREHDGVDSIVDANADGIEAMLAAVSTLAPATLARRASTLRQWHAWCRGSAQHAAAVGGQLGLFEPQPAPDVPAPNWPDDVRFPHNEGDSQVGAVVDADLSDVGDVLMVTGYASLDRVVRFLARRDYSARSSVRILFGNEPFLSRQESTRITGHRFSDEVRDYWLQRGISVLLAAEVVAARDAVERQPVEVRTAPTRRGIHAKMFCSDRGVTLGSSNFTANGMGRQSEANARFEPDESRFREARELAEGLWGRGEDYREAFIALLDSLLRAVTWQEAVARACAEVLEGDWARRYVPPDELAALAPPLWPHQLQGVSQAMWILHNLGSVLVADATGSGKTRMGAWLLRAAYDRQVRSGRGQRLQPVVMAPPAVVSSWSRWLQECGLRWRVDSHGPLSNKRSLAFEELSQAIEETELLAVDEAHNFLNNSNRTKRLRTHYADNAILFTATPINRGASDLLSLVELLGPDNFPDTALETLKKLSRLRRNGVVRAAGEDRETLRAEIRQFMVRRTRHDLNRIVDGSPDQYGIPGRRAARYPRHKARYYDVPATSADLRRAARIVELADELKGVARLGKKLKVPTSLAIEGLSESDYLQRVVASSAALARHFVLDCLRSSRIAVYEHVHGTVAAIERLAPELDAGSKKPTGDTIGTLTACAGVPPKWQLSSELKADAPTWLWDKAAHKAACEHDIERYREIGELVAAMSEQREKEKVDHLARLLEHGAMVIAYDSHVLSLRVFERKLSERQVATSVFTGAGGQSAKRRAVNELGLGSTNEKMVALCTDAFSEGMNLQKASVVVHLDTPTVIRTAEQRAGRVDRMDSPHDDVEIWWPRDPPGFAPRRKELLRERHEMVGDLIGANLQMPDQPPDDVIDVEELASQASVDRTDDPLSLYDAFRPVRSLVDADGLVGPTIYERMRTSQADVVSCISLVESDRPWGFFAVAGLDRVAPRWILLDGIDAAPEADLARIAEALACRLRPDTPDHALDERAGQVIAKLTRRLQACERELLPMRRRRALELAEAVLPKWRKAASGTGDAERAQLLWRIEGLLKPAAGDEPQPDPRAVADAWLRVVRPVQQREMQRTSRGKKRLWTLNDLRKPLIEAPIGTEVLARAFERVPLLPPVAERVVAMVVGVPTSSPNDEA